MDKRETRITQAVIAWIKEHGGDGYHVHGSSLQRGGEPDVSGEIPGEGRWLHLKIEVKTPTGEPTKRQLHRLKKYWTAGYVVGIVTSVDELQRLLNLYTVWQRGGQTFVFGKLFKYPEIYSGIHNGGTLATPRTDG